MYNRQVVPPISNTWVFLEFITHIKKGSRKLIQVLDRDLVLWRTQSGKINLFDAYCPHLGGNLSYGKVKGEVLECNYHKKCFNSEGRCNGLSVAARAYTLYEINNMVFAWFGDKAPEWTVPDFLTGFFRTGDSRWKLFRTLRFNYKYPPKNVGENSADANHFKTYHRMCKTYEPAQMIEINKHHLVCKLKMQGNSPWSKKAIQQLNLEVNSIGACIFVVDSSIKIKDKEFAFKFIYLCTPTVGENTRFTVSTAIKTYPLPPRSIVEKISAYIFANISFCASVFEFCRESRTVFEPKSNFWRPPVTQQETIIQQYYDWYNQFYTREKLPEEI